MYCSQLIEVKRMAQIESTTNITEVHIMTATIQNQHHYDTQICNIHVKELDVIFREQNIHLSYIDPNRIFMSGRNKKG